MATVALAGCGDDGSPTASKSLTRAEYIAKGDALCKANEPLLFDLEETVRGLPNDPGKLARHLGSTLSVAQKTNARWNALPIPKGDERPLLEFKERREQAVLLGQSAIQALDAADRRTLIDLTPRIVENALEQNAVARGYGFKVCGHDL